MDRGHAEYATEAQGRYLDLYFKHGSYAGAAAEAGISPQALARSLKRLEAAAARRGYAPAQDQTHPSPEGQIVQGVSTLYDDAGAIKAQWVKTKLSDELRREQWEDFVEALVERTPLAPTVDGPRVSDDLMVVYPMGDPHLGMYAWAEETGQDFDLEIARTSLTRAIEHLVFSVPPARQAVVLNLGDFFHADNSQNRTSRSGHALDVDTRYARVLRVGAETMVGLIDRARMRHHHVTVRNVIGNHDDHSSLALSLLLQAHYRDCLNVTVETSPAEHWYLRYGKNLIGSTHGDKTKLENLPLIMATDRPEDWGASVHRYWYTGHVHHKRVIEVGNVVCESFRTLAARDSYTASAGYRSGRDMNAIVLHPEHGEIARHRVDAVMLDV